MMSWSKITRHRVFTMGSAVIFSAALLAIILWFHWLATGRFGWLPLTAVLLVLIISGVFFMSTDLQKALGEDRNQKRRASHVWVIVLVWILLFPALSIYVLVGDVIRTNTTAQSGLMLIAPVLGGLSLNAATRFEDNQELLCVAQKFIMATVFFVIFLPSIYVADFVLQVDPNSLEFTWKGISRGVYFWLAAISFYSGIALFSVGLVDLVFALIDLRSRRHLNAPNDFLQV